MNQQYPQSPRQSPSDQSNSPTPGSPPRKSSDGAPCDSGDVPQYPPCPEAKPCPQPPERPCPPPPPDPCNKPPPPPEDCEDPCDPPPTDPCSDGEETPITTPALQLDALRKAAETGQRKLQKYEPLKAKLADVTQRIAALEILLEGQVAAAASYTDFFRAVEVFKSSLECSIPTIRCQLSIDDKKKKCIARSITCVEERVKKALDARDAQATEVKRLETRQNKLQGDLDWAKKWSEFFKTGLQAQVNAQRDDLKKLQALLDPSKDQCEVWFYLSEMEGMLRSARGDEDSAACYVESLNIASFLDCWSPDCFISASEYWVVTFNSAESAAKVGAIELAEAQKRLIDLEAAAKEAVAKRREWILKELKTQGCCAPSKCP